MPFTFSHPVAIVPFHKTNLPFSALVIGSMAPDFLYFWNLEAKGHYGHTFEGLFFFSVPVGLIVFLIFQHLLKIPFVNLFPRSHQKKLSQFATTFRFNNFKAFLKIVSAILVGAVTHIVWDSFTHGNGWAVQNWSFLTTSLFMTPIGNFTIYKFLQYSGHLLGMPLLLFLYYQWLRKPINSQINSPINFSFRLKITIILTLVLTSGALGLLYSYLTITPLVGIKSLGVLISRSLVTSISVFFLCSCIYVVVFM